MNPARSFARASAATLGTRPIAPRRTVEVRVVVSGREEDAFAASENHTLVSALRPILRHLDGRAVIEMVGVERSALVFGSSERRQPLADLSEAMAFLSS